MHHFIFTVLIFITAIAFTPGPNALILAATGSQLGFRKSLPAIFGVAITLPTMITVVGLILGATGAYDTIITEILTPCAVIFLLYLAYRTATLPLPSRSSLDAQLSKSPATFWSLSLFQWVNPRTWALSLAVHSIYLPFGVDAGLSPTVATIMMGFIVLPVAFIRSVFWAAMGALMARLLHNRPRLFRLFNIFLACLLIASLYPLLKGVI